MGKGKRGSRRGKKEIKEKNKRIERAKKSKSFLQLKKESYERQLILFGYT